MVAKGYGENASFSCENNDWVNGNQTKEWLRMIKEEEGGLWVEG